MAYSSIVKPEDYFNTKLWTGNGGTQSITGIGYAPDFVWIKKRTDADGARIFDTVRGAAKGIFTNSTQAETTVTSELSAFDSDGFTLGASDAVNGNTKSYVSWNWLGANGTASNSDGDIASTVSANTTAGFSIVKFTANGSNSDTIGHGLGVAPKIVLYKRTDSTGPWYWLYKPTTSSLAYLILNGTDAKADLTLGTYGFTTSTTFTNIGFGNTHQLIAYCFAEKKGYSKIGKYTGNGGSQFIYTGFKPAFVIEKRSSNSSEWDMYDNKRNTFNAVTKVLKPNNNDAEATYTGLNFLSNGFEALGSLNDSGQTLIYMAFAENPFVGNDSGTAVPVTAG